MNALTADRLAELAIAALERTAFVLAEPIDAGQANDLPKPSCHARIRFVGPCTGWVTLSASEGFVRELASSMLGVEPADIDLRLHGEDAIKELANIVGGSVIVELGGFRVRFSLGLPEFMPSNAAAPGSGGQERCFVESEGQLLVITWMLESATHAAAA